MLVAVICTDKTGAIETRKANREAHLEYIKQTGVVTQAGPFLDADGMMCGSLLILDVADMDAARSWADSDPYAGVRNYQARNHMRTMKTGDLGFFYHSQKEKEIVGIVEVISESHPDSTTEDERWDCVDIKAVRTLPSPVTLAMCKADPRLADMVLVNNTRLSVQPVSETEWNVVLEMAGDV